MKVLEFHFNPKAAEDSFFQVLIEESLSPQLGNLYLAGELRHALPHQARFLKKLLSDLRDLFALGSKQTKEQELQGAVRHMNVRLRAEVKKGNVAWLGNLHVAALNLKIDKRGTQTLTLAKAGSIKVLLSREGKLRDLEQEGKGQAPESSGVRMFSRTISGQMVEGDKVFCMTKDLYDAFEKQHLLSDLTFLNSEKQLQKLFEAKGKDLSAVSGLLLGLLIEEVKLSPVTAKKQKRGKKAPSPVLSTLPRLRLPDMRGVSFSRPVAFAHWRIGLIALFVLLLGVGFLLFKGEREAQLKEALMAQDRVASLIVRAEAEKDSVQKNKLLQEAWKLATPQARMGKPKASEFRDIVSDLESSLRTLNLVEEVQAGQPVFRLPGGFKGGRLMFSGVEFVAYAPFTSQIAVVNAATGETESFAAPRPVKLGALLNGSPVFYADPGLFLKRNEERVWQEVPIRSPYERPGFADMESFGGSLYFFDPGAREIIKYAAPDFSAGSASPSIWLESETERKPGSAVSGASLAVDGNVWIVADGREIQRYFAGVFRETLSPVVFPFLDGITSIYASPQLPYLYLLNSSQGRVILLTKFGELAKQYDVTGLASIDDIVPSPDGSSLYLLSGSEIYRFSITSVQP